MIYITCGTCGTSQGYKNKHDGALTLPASEERRLVARGVAEYVTKPIISPPTARADGTGEGEGIDLPDKSPPAEEMGNGEGDIPARFVTPFAEQLEITNGHFTKESLLNLTRQQMEALALALNTDIGQCKNKGDIAELLLEIEVAAPTEDGNEQLPELSAEAPVL